MKIIGIIPARFASSRFPGKPLANIQGKPMIQRVYEQAKKAPHLSEVIVATDDALIFQTIKMVGGAAVMTASTHLNGTARCAEVIQQYPGYDFVVNIQGDEPYIHPEQIDELCNLFSDDSAGIYTQAKKISDPGGLQNSNVVKVVFDENNYAINFFRQPEQALQTVQYKHIGIYGYRIALLNEIVQLPPSVRERTQHLEQLRWLDNGFKIKVGITGFESISVDLPGDIERFMPE